MTGRDLPGRGRLTLVPRATWLAGLLLVAALGQPPSPTTAVNLGMPDGPAAGPGAPQAYSDLYFPLAMNAIEVEALPTGRVVTPRPTAEPSATASSTSTGEPTLTPSITPTPEPTAFVATGRIHGRMTDGGVPMAPGFGGPLGPQIELRRRTAGQWEKVANAVTTDGGVFQFVNPPPLESGEVYQVVWVNDVLYGSDFWVHRWWSRLIAEFGDGTDVDVGVFELADLRYVFPCHDCHRSLPITFEWTPRADETEIYRWSLFKGCGDVEDRHNAYRTQSLGHASEYTLDAPPPGFTYDTVYCWYIYIEDGQNGTGWPFHDWRTAFLSVPQVERRLLPGVDFLAGPR